VQAMTGHGGWPMTVFLTPDGAPFYAGTYYPNEDRHGMPSFRRVLDAVSNAYAGRPDDVARTAASIREMYASAAELTRSAGPLSPELLDRVYGVLRQQYDDEHGGFGGAPKFPQAMSLDFVLTRWARTGDAGALAIALDSFRHMARGGIYDQVGGGFARYAVDAIWLVPHFEKMLYDNALLARFGVHLWQATKDGETRRVVEETLMCVAREMTSPEGGFYSSLDADSEGHEGKFYLWTADELDALLGDDAPAMKAHWGVTADGNFEGKTILSVVGPAVSEETLARAKRTLYDARAKRVWPGRDDKILASWNALMLRAVAEAARAFGLPEHRALAQRNAEFLFAKLVRDGRVYRTYKDGRAKITGFLEDHAGVGLAALAMYELTFDRVWLDRARDLAASMVELFWDDRTGAFYDTASDAETLITRPRDISDNATPSGTSLAVDLLVRLAEVLHDVDARRRATYVLETLAPGMARYPMAFGHALTVADMSVNGAVEVAIVGDPGSAEFKALSGVVAERYVPALVLAGGQDNGDVALLADRPMRDSLATAYVCRNYACEEPVTSAARLALQLDAWPRLAFPPIT
jgi:uncharacterized protein YyaL (SSP411 family)